VAEVAGVQELQELQNKIAIVHWGPICGAAVFSEKLQNARNVGGNFLST
jgi:hypothetical protein